MSLPRNAENEPQKSEPKPKRVYFTQEMLRRDAAKRHRKASCSQATEIQEMPMETTKTPVIPELDEIEARATELTQELQEESEQDSEHWKEKEQVMLMTTSVINMCRLLRNFSEVMTAEMAKSAESQMRNLSIQKQYAESVKASTVEVTRDIYYQFRDEQTQAFQKVQKFYSDSCDAREKSINACADEVRSATKAAEQATRQISRSAERFRKIKTIRDLLYYAAPVLVAVDIIRRVADAVAQYL